MEVAYFSPQLVGGGGESWTYVSPKLELEH